MKKFDLLIFNMSEWREWTEEGTSNRNRQIFEQLSKSEKIDQIMAVDFLPFSFKRTIRVYRDHFIKPKENYVYKSKRAQAQKVHLNKFNRDIIIYTTIKGYLSRNAICPEISKILTQQKFNQKKLILWSYNPFFPECFKNISARIKIFDAVDNWAEHPIFYKYHQRLRKNYQIIDRTADCVFTVAKDLTKIFPTCPRVSWVPNGVDLNHFISISKIPIKELAKINKPIIGYHGVIQSRLDVELIKKVAQENQNLSFVFVGPVWPDAGVDQIKKFPNVHFLGPVGYGLLPAYLNAFDVGIIPHKTNQFTNSMNPIKIYEYLAAGKPIVSTSVAGTENFQPQLKIAASAKEFSRAIKEALRENNSDRIKQRQAVAAEHSWTSRLDKMWQIIEN